MVKFLHTADWQLGMTRSFLSDEAQGRFTQARINAIGTMADLALKGGAKFGVVAGDVFESNLLSPQVVARSLEAMRASRLTWYLLPGNHDPVDAASIYRERDFLEHKPENVQVIADQLPISAGEGIELVGAPWPNKRPLRDLVKAALAGVEPARGVTRIAVGHGAVDTFAPDKKNPANISLSDAEKALEDGRIHYLALGDRHSSTDVGGAGRIRYSGAPEPTDYDEDRPGFALLVDVTPERCEVRELPVATWRFVRESFDLSGDTDVPRLRAWFDALTSKENVIVKIGLKGALSLQGHAELARVLEEAGHLLGALEAWERESQLLVRPTALDLESLNLTGYARATLGDLQAKAAGEPRTGGIAGGRGRACLALPNRASPTDRRDPGGAVKILDLQIKDFKGVIDGRVQPRPSGVTIIVGPNEAGKSSLLEGFDFLLNEFDSSLKREVKESKPIGRDEGPTVEAEIEAGAYRFTVRKRWLRRPETELRVSQPRAEVKTGREAHERMREILESSVDIDLLGAVRYLQGSASALLHSRLAAS